VLTVSSELCLENNEHVESTFLLEGNILRSVYVVYQLLENFSVLVWMSCVRVNTS